MGVAIKGSLKQYMNGLKDSFYGIIYFYQLDQKIKEQNERKRERMQEEIQSRFGIFFLSEFYIHSSLNSFEYHISFCLLLIQFSCRRRRSHMESRRNRFHTQATGVSVNSEPTLCGRIALSAAMSSFIWISIWSFNTFLLPTLRHQAQVK